MLLAALLSSRCWRGLRFAFVLPRSYAATMPNGQKYEEWLKSQDRKEDGKNE
jgi:hypothetical protein